LQHPVGQSTTQGKAAQPARCTPSMPAAPPALGPAHLGSPSGTHSPLTPCPCSVLTWVTASRKKRALFAHRHSTAGLGMRGGARCLRRCCSRSPLASIRRSLVKGCTLSVSQERRRAAQEQAAQGRRLPHLWGAAHRAEAQLWCLPRCPAVAVVPYALPCAPGAALMHCCLGGRS
jgi:hypothetical protein